ncbi:MAG: hypothetical protein VX808_02085, partial [Actinomycetota bacterium]|nr:hypothetical protein [Actinomycetota bacterium]
SSKETVLAVDEVVDEGTVSIVDFRCATTNGSMALLSGGGVVYHWVRVPVPEFRLAMLPTGVPNASM